MNSKNLASLFDNVKPWFRDYEVRADELKRCMVVRTCEGTRRIVCEVSTTDDRTSVKFCDLPSERRG